MVDRRRVIIAVFVLAAAAGLWWLLKRPSAEERIRAQLDALCRLVSKEPGEGTAQAAFKGLALPPRPTVGVIRRPMQMISWLSSTIICFIRRRTVSRLSWTGRSTCLETRPLCRNKSGNGC